MAVVDVEYPVVNVGLTSATLDRNILTRGSPLGAAGLENQPVTVSNLKHGRHLQKISMFPNDNEMLMPFGCIWTPSSTQFKGTNLLAVGLIENLGLLAATARKDAEIASARLEQLLVKRGIHEAVEAANDRMKQMESRHELELQIFKSKEHSTQEEVTALAETIVKSQHLTTSAIKDRDNMLSEYAEAERLRIQQELSAQDDVQHQTQTATIAPLGTRPLCEDCLQRPAEVVCTLCRGRMCSICSERVHSGGLMKTHPVRPLDPHIHGGGKKRRAIDTSMLSQPDATSVRKLESRYEKMKERCQAMKVDWTKFAEATKACAVIEREKQVLSEYIKTLEVENDGLRRLQNTSYIPNRMM